MNAVPPVVTDTAPPPRRVASVDMLRGIVMVVMALDHVRDYFHDQALAFDPLDVEKTYPLLYATRWVTHFCAPVFVFLAGISAFLQLSRGKSRGELSRFLLLRGLWLILMELTVISFGWSFGVDFVFLQVIWAIGWSMIILAALVWAPWPAVLAVGIVVVAGHNLLDGVKPRDLGAFAPLWKFLAVQHPIIAEGGLRGFVAYPILAWAGLMAAGYGAGRLFVLPQAARRRALYLAGGVLTLAFVALRWSHGYGDPNGWTAQASPGRTAMDFLSTTKYPPSLLYVCMTIGPALLALPLLERLKGRWAEPWLTFGTVPFFFYIAHIYLAHALSAALSLATGYPVWGVDDIFRNPQILQGFGLSLGLTYLVWLSVVVALYVPCRWFAGVKRRHPGGWTSYL